MSVIKCDVSKFEDQINLLKKIAGYSTLTHKHGACLMMGNKVYTMGYNKYIREDIVNNQLIKFTIHAEIDALCKIDNRLVKGMDILIIRLGNPKTNKLRNSRPCNSCIEKLSQKGIRKVYYSNEDGDIVYEFIESMPKYHISSGNQMRWNLK